MSEFKYIKMIEEKVGEGTFENTVKKETVYQLKRIADAMENLKLGNNKKSDPNAPATEPQKALLTKHNKEFSENITKGDASKMIEEMIASNKK